jgi:endonuclease/exonuclease/phosphatase family metal-dependent hydrolase
VVGCGEREEPDTPPSDGGDQLTVMTSNVWYGGVSVDLGRIGEAIRVADADIVGVQEPEGNLRRIADAAGLPYVDESLHLISRFPLFPSRRDGIRFAYAEVEPDRVVAISNVHLTCCPYGPNLARNGKSASDVAAAENRLRLPEVEPYARALTGLADEGVPVFMTGDMNSPSHLDWTADAVEARDLPYELQWPASKALADAGMRDSYREANPDPAAVPGLTWTPGTPPPNVRPDETTDRIDWVLTAGPTETTDSRLVGEEGGPDVEVGVSPWGSDHRAVASTFSVEPAAAPDLVSADPRVVTQGDRVTLRYALGGAGGGREVGVLAGELGSGSGDHAIETIPVFDGADHVAPMFGTGTLDPGRYRAGLIDGGGELLATSPFWVESRNSRPTIETTKSTYSRREPIGVHWSNAPGNKLDYVGVFEAGDPNLYNYLGFVYTGARPDGSLQLTKSDLGDLPPGRYVANLMLDDGYTILASTPFAVR